MGGQDSQGEGRRSSRQAQPPTGQATADHLRRLFSRRVSVRILTVLVGEVVPVCGQRAPLHRRLLAPNFGHPPLDEVKLRKQGFLLAGSAR